MPLNVDQVVSKLDELPPLSDTSARLTEAMEHPASSMEMLASVIETDPTLAQRVLKLANSAYYAVPGGVETIKRAVMFIGLSSLHQISLYLSSMNILSQSRPIPQWLMGHSTAVALIARHIAIERAPARRDTMLVAGLLHDLGWLALHSFFPDECQRYSDAVRAGAAHGTALELEILGVNHEVIGSRLATKWRFTPPLVALIGGHHAPTLPEGMSQPQQQLTDIIAVADAWAWTIGRPGISPPHTMVPTIAPERLARLRLEATMSDRDRAAIAAALAQESVLL